MEEIPNNQERVFTGVWIPVEIMLEVNNGLEAIKVLERRIG